MVAFQSLTLLFVLSKDGSTLLLHVGDALLHFLEFVLGVFLALVEIGKFTFDVVTPGAEKSLDLFSWQRTR